MAMIVVIQMTLVTLAMAQAPVTENNSPDRWWFFGTTALNPSSSTSTTDPCLLRSQPVFRRDDYTYTPGIGAHKVHTRAATWNEARRICEEESGHLAIINSIAESNVITDLFNKSGAIFGATGGSNWALIGFHDLYQEGEYVTIHGHSLARSGFTQWFGSDPSRTYNGVEEDCGSVNKNGGLNDIPCEGKYAFICELPVFEFLIQR